MNHCQPLSYTVIICVWHWSKNFFRFASFLSQAEISDAPVEFVYFTGKPNWSSSKKKKKKTSPTVILSSLASLIGNLCDKQKKQSPTVSLSSFASSIGNLHNKTKSDCKSLLALFSDAPVESVCIFHWQVQLVIQ